MIVRIPLAGLFLLSATLLSFSVMATSQNPFDLDSIDEMVCKINVIDGSRDEKNKQCYLLTDNLTGTIEVIQKTQAHLDFLRSDREGLTLNDLDNIGGSILISDDQLEALVKNYRRLSIRNFAVDPTRTVEQGDFMLLPFVVDVYWKGALLLEGTLHVEGTISIPKEIEGNAGDSFGSARFSSYSDSSTEQKLESLRSLETAARNLHFKAINGISTDVDQSTMDLLSDVVGPVLVGELLYIPLVKALGFVSSDDGVRL